MKVQTINRREDRRVKVPAVLKFRQNDGKNTTKWDVSLVRNISKSGIFFNSSFEFKEGTELEIKVHNPKTERIDSCKGTVVRSIEVKEHRLFYETAVKLKALYDNSLGSFYEFLDYSLALA